MANVEGGNTNAGSHWRRQIVEQKIAENEAHLMDSRKVIQAFEEKGYELKELLNSTSAIMTSLPLDILSEIFITLACNELTYMRDGRLPVQFLIGRICRAWRRIAWSTPRLWCSVYLRFSQKRLDVQSRLLQDWIRRGGSSPLELQFSQTLDKSGWEPSVDVFKPIMASCHRWAKVTLHDGLFTGLAFALGQRRHHFPLLSSLEILRPIPPPTHRYLTKWNFHSAPPNLQRLKVPNFTPGPSLGVNWACLTYLSMTFEFGLGESLEILGLVCSLETLHCDVCEGSEPLTNLQLPVYHLLHLGEIAVEGPPSMVMLLLRSITTPALKKLNLEMEDGNQGELWTTTLVELVRRSSCSLVDLVIDQSNVANEEHVLDMLRQLSSLKTCSLHCYSPFTLSNLSINQMKLASHINEGRQQECLPNLEDFSYSGDISFTLKAMFRMLKSRQQHSRMHAASISEVFPLEGDSLQLATEETGNCSTLPKKLFIHILYHNVEWFQAKHPNDIRDFFQEVTTLAAGEVTLKLDYPYDHGDPDEEEDNSE